MAGQPSSSVAWSRTREIAEGAAIVIRQIVARHNHPGDDAASRAYLAGTGRSAQDIEQASRGGR